MKRREFLKTMGAAAGGAFAAASMARGAELPSEDVPNILLIMTDQQFADAMSCRMGTEFIHTPNMDSLAAEGTLFTRAYCPNPLCKPSRASMFTGRYAHETGVQTNSSLRRQGKKEIDATRFPCLGTILQSAGYDTGYVGKWHMPYRKKDASAHGFDYMAKLHNKGHDSELPGPAGEFIKRDRDRPFFLVTSFCNPHNICEWSRGQKLPDGPIGEAPPPSECPPLLPNHLPPENETDIMSIMREGYHKHRLFPVGDYPPGKWRQYRWAYYRLIEKVDALIGRVLGALRESGQEEDTVVVFAADHGECHGVHNWNQKTVFYDESARVPLIISRKGAAKPGTSDRLVQTGVDLVPTLCEYAGIAVPPGLPGKSLKGTADGRAPSNRREFVVSSNRMIQCEPVDGRLYEPDGRMVRSDRYKYCVYSLGEDRESLVDMKNDPGEMVNLAGSPEFREIIQSHRACLRKHGRKHGDELAIKMLNAITG